VAEQPGRYRPTSRPYTKRYRYKYASHVFDKLRALDLPLAEFQQLLGAGEVIAEAIDEPGQTRELILLIDWLEPLHLVIAVDDAHKEERLITVYEPDPGRWSPDLRRRR
jgi:hypothetical protein